MNSHCFLGGASFLFRWAVLLLGGLEERDHILAGGCLTHGPWNSLLGLRLSLAWGQLLLGSVLVRESHIIDKVVVHLLCTGIKQSSADQLSSIIFFVRLLESALLAARKIPEEL